MSLTPYNSTLPSDAAAFQAYGNAVAWTTITIYMLYFAWFVANWGNHPGARAWTTIGHMVAPLPVQPTVTGWRQIGEITFSPSDVKPAITQRSPLYQRTYASGKQSWRFWDDMTEEWVYHAALPANVLYN